MKKISRELRCPEGGALSHDPFFATSIRKVAITLTREDREDNCLDKEGHFSHRNLISHFEEKEMNLILQWILFKTTILNFLLKRINSWPSLCLFDLPMVCQRLLVPNCNASLCHFASKTTGYFIFKTDIT